MMGGRTTSMLLAAVLALASWHAGAADSQPRRLVKIGALTPSWGPTPAIVAMREGLQQMGYRENEHFVIGVRFTQGDLAAMPAAARDLVRQDVDIIVAAGGGNATVSAARAASNRIPIIFLGGDPVAAELVKSYARPGGNVTGVVGLDAELTPKRMEIFRELVPGLKRLFVPYDATNEIAVAQLARYRDAARRLGLVLVERPVRSEAEAEATIAQFRRSDADGIFAPSNLSLNIPGFILETAPKAGLPVMFDQPFYVERGGLASYSRNEQELGRQAARIIDRLIKGAKPADIPVERATQFELVVNLKTAKALGITIPQSALLQATRVIE